MENFQGLFLFLITLAWLCDMSRQLRLEQRLVIKFMTAQGSTPIQCWRNLCNVYGEAALGKTRVRAWHKQFREGDLQTKTSDKAQPGRPKSGRCCLHIDKVQTQLQQEQQPPECPERQCKGSSGKTYSSVMSVPNSCQGSLQMNKRLSESRSVSPIWTDSTKRASPSCRESSQATRVPSTLLTLTQK